MMIRAVLLDLGNVLAFHDNRRLFARFGARAQLAPDDAERRMFEEAGWEEANRGELTPTQIHARAQAALGITLPFDEFATLFCCHFSIHAEVMPLVERLFGRVKVGLISNTNVIHAAYLRPKLPILSRFDAVILSNEVGMTKPDPRIFERALDAIGVEAAEAVYFDDLPQYVAAAERVGITGRLFTTAEKFRADLAALGLLEEP